MGEPAGADRTHYEAESAEIVTLPPVLLARLASRAGGLATDAAAVRAAAVRPVWASSGVRRRASASGRGVRCARGSPAADGARKLTKCGVGCTWYVCSRGHR